MAGSAAVRALIVDDDPGLIGEYRQILCADGAGAPGLDRSLGAFESELIGAAVGHQHFPAVDVAAFGVGQEAVEAARDAVKDGRPFLVAFIDSELTSGIDGLETAERIRAADARIQIVIMAGRSPLHPVEMAARVPPADRLSFVKKPFHPFEIQTILIGCRQRLRSEGWKPAQRSAGAGDSHRSMLQAILDRIPGGILVFDRHDKLAAASSGMRRLFPDVADVFVPGAAYHEIRRQLNSDSPAQWGAPGGGQVWQHRGSRWALVSESVTPSGETYCLFCDITEHTQREAVRGRAAHSAHLTQVFAGLCGTIARLFAEHSAADGIEPVMARLKTVAQQQRLTPRAVDLGQYLGRAVRRIRRRLPTGIGLEVVFDAGLWSIDVDPDGLARALAELTANACDAMAGGGRIVVEAVNVRVSAGSELATVGLAAGDYVRVSLQDTGPGMPAEVADHALVPFRSHRDGRHFGLGLPIVHAFALESGGWLEIDGGAGSGVTVRLYLPKRAPGASSVVVDAAVHHPDPTAAAARVRGKPLPGEKQW